jgi:hypothetical protein
MPIAGKISKAVYPKTSTPTAKALIHSAEKNKQAVFPGQLVTSMMQMKMQRN